MKKLFLALVFMTNLSNAAELKIHYNRLGNTDNWNMWVWNEEDKQQGFQVLPEGRDDFGLLFKLDLKGKNLEDKIIGLLPRRGQWEVKDSPERYLKDKKVKDIYLLEGDTEIYFAPPEISTKITGVWLDSNSLIRIAFSRPVPADYVSGLNISLKSQDKVYVVISVNGIKEGLSNAYLLNFAGGTLSYKQALAGDYKLLSSLSGELPVDIGSIVYEPSLVWKGKLGAFTENDKTIIRVFAPKASNVFVKILDMTTGKEYLEPMHYKESGVWEKVFSSDISGKYYRLSTIQNGRHYEGLDPYAKCVSNDDGYALIGTEKTQVSTSPVFDLSEAILYEVHLRDLTVDKNSGAEHKGKYLGAAQHGTHHPSYSDITTGLEHIAELGANVVHILPFQDFQNNDNFSSYNWGYMPVNFNSPEGSYATEQKGFARVKEAKQMISAFHEKGIKVVMDVVYNHTAENRSEIHNFNAMSMDYYYRINPDGSYSNGSGCGNEFNTEAPMARKFIIDSLLHWVREYKVDGFRFDLMGLIDLEAVDEIIAALKAEKPDIIIYGEPWAGGKTPTIGVSKGAQSGKGYAVFGDNFRDALKGSVFNDREKGYVQAGVNRDKVMRGIRGSVEDFASSPMEAINYVSCHDNHTLWDRINRSANVSDEEKIKMDKLANAIVLTSQGIPFIHAGEEFLRTKKGEHNSYNLPDEINMLDWSRKKQYIDVFRYYKDLIALRKAHQAFRMKTSDEVLNNLKFFDELGIRTPNQGIGYILHGSAVGDVWESIVVLINPSRKTETFNLPNGIWTKVFDEHGFYKTSYTELKSSAKIPPLSLVILKSAGR